MLPDTLVNFSEGLCSPKYANPACLSIEPVALEGAPVGPDQLTIAALRVVIADHLLPLVRVTAGLLLTFPVKTATPASMVSFLHLLVLRLLHLAIYLERAHLAHILHRAEITRSELQLPILDTQLLILALRLYRLAQQCKRRFRVRAYFSA